MKTKHITLISILALVGLGIALMSYGISDGVYITVNGEEIDNPLIKGLGGIFGIVVAIITIFCGFLIMVLVLSGTSVILLGTFVAISLLFVSITLPFLLPVIIPLCILLFVCMARSGAKTSSSHDD